MASLSNMTLEEEYKLISLAAAGDETAKSAILQRHDYLVRKVAKKFVGNGLEMDDLLQEGYIGILSAIDNFDPKLGWRFSTYAVYWIKHMINKALCEQGRRVRLPNNIHDKMLRLSKVEKELENSHVVITTVSIAEAMGVEETEVEELLSNRIDVCSLDVDTEEDSTLMDMIEDENGCNPYQIMAKKINGQIFEKILDTLSNREAEILSFRFAIPFKGNTPLVPMTLEEIGDLYGLSKERVRQIVETSLRKLRNPCRLKLLRECLED